MNKVEDALKYKAINRKGIMLFSKEDAMEFVKLCRNEMLVILGIDCFLLGENWIQPNMENSIDFSNLSLNIDRYDRAKEFITARDDKFYFEFVCAD